MPRYSPRTGLLQTYQVGPFDSTHLYVQWGGKLPGNEQWSCGFRMWKSGGSTEADGAAVLVNVAAALQAFHVREGTAIHSSALFNFVKVNAIAVDGTYIGSGTNEATFADNPGGIGGAQPANQLTLGVSTVTGFNRGPAHRGRFYLPSPGITIGTDGRMPTAVIDGVADSCITMRTAVNSAGAGHVMVVMSRKAGAPGHRAITGFEIGTVVDTQRRRRRSLVEDYRT